MAIDIGPKIGIDGEKEFRAQLNQINTSLKTLGTEMKRVSSEFQENGNGQEALRRKNEVLNKTIDEQRKKLEMVQKALQESSEKYGETSEKTQKWQQVVNRTETALNELQAEIRQNEQALQEMDSGLRDVETGLSKVDKAAEDIGDIGTEFKEAAENGVMVLSGALAGLATAFTGATESSREYRTDQGKLQVAFESVGFSAKQAKDAFIDIYSILGEDDTSVEAANHLAELTTNEKELATWTGEILPGVFAKFGDSLPLEGLTEAANETAKVGKVTGTLADALNWAGINEEKFNESLEKCSSEQERQQLITETLSKIYGDASKSYKEINAEVIEANKAQANLTDSIANLGKVAEPTISRIKNILADLINTIADMVGKFNELPKSTQNAILAIGGIGIAAGPTVKGISAVTSGVSKLKNGLKSFFSPAKTAAAAASGVGTAAVGAATGIKGATTAFSTFSSILSKHPIGLVITALGVLGTAIGVYVESTKDAEDETSKFQEKIRETRAAVNEYKDSMSQLSEEREMAIAKSESEFSYYAGLKTELDGIVEKNGKIKDGYEQRAKTITTILSDALGVEMEINGGVISGYEKLSDSIDEVIEKKRAEAFISAKEPEYKKAIETEQTLLKNLTIARKNLNSAEERYLEAKKSGNQEMITSTRTVHEELKKIYDQALADYEKNNEIIKDVESDMAAFEEGHYEQIYSTYENGEKAISSLTLEEAKKRLEMVRSEKDASLQIYKETGSETARVTAENYGKEENSLLLHISEMSNIVARDTKFIDSIKKLAKEGYSAFESVPWGNVGNEIINGVDGGMRKQIEKLRNTALYISGQILNSFRSSLKMNSPSKLMRDEVGIPISEGIAVGEEQGIPFIKKANKSIVREISNLQMPPKKINYLFENITPIKPAPFMMSQGRPIDVTVYSVLDGKIISKTVQKDISRSQEMRMRAKGAAT